MSLPLQSCEVEKINNTRYILQSSAFTGQMPFLFPNCVKALKAGIGLSWHQYKIHL